MEDILEAVEIIPEEHIPERKFVEAFEVPVIQIQEGIVEVYQLPPQERTSERTVEQIMDVSVPVPQIHEQILEVAIVIPQDRISERIIEHALDLGTNSGSRGDQSAEAHPGAYRRTHS